MSLTCVVACLFRCIFLATRAGWKFLALGEATIYILLGFPDRTQTPGECVLLGVCPGLPSSQAHTGRPDLGTASADNPLLCPLPSPVGPEIQGWVPALSLWVPW